jgi:hypothetical protein
MRGEEVIDELVDKGELAYLSPSSLPLMLSIKFPNPVLSFKSFSTFA